MDYKFLLEQSALNFVLANFTGKFFLLTFEKRTKGQKMSRKITVKRLREKVILFAGLYFYSVSLDLFQHANNAFVSWA